MDKTNIKDLTYEQFKSSIVKMNEPAYRAGQIFAWLYEKGIDDFDGMKIISKDLKEKLKESYYIGGIELFKHKKSKDKTEKFLFKLNDDSFVETVLILSKKRKTICISTQVGCKFACKFCTSGLRGFTRNLTPSEIVNQIIYLTHNLGHTITNYVFMGMGEPLDNYDNVIAAIQIMNNKTAMAIGARRITLSTCGIIPAIRKLKKLKLQINLSLSLHATNDKLRSEIVPANRKYPLSELLRCCEDFIKDKNRIITLEYVLIKDKNDSSQDAYDLSLIAKRLRAKVNLIPYSQTRYFNYLSSNEKTIKSFMKVLKSNKVNATLRESKGKDIQAACGQLAGNFA